MSAKLFAAGAVLTVLAFASEEHFPVRQGDEPTEAEATFAVRMVSGVNTAFERLTSSAVRQMIETTDRSLDQLRPATEATSGARGKTIREMYAATTDVIAEAKQELEAGRAFKALDLALSANGRIADIKKEFERE